jgi:predicted phosphohydrolase
MNEMGTICSDIHLDHASNGTKRKFLQEIEKLNTPLFIAGDISDGRKVTSHLEQIAEACKHDVYFVLGNHDYYHSSFAEIDSKISYLMHHYPNLIYLPHMGIVRLNSDTCVIGPDSWYDAKIAPYPHLIPLGMSDFDYIQDLRGLNRFDLFNKFQAKASAGLVHLKEMVGLAVTKYKNIIIMSHPVPFGSMNIHQTSLSPFYIWYEAGMFLGDFASDNLNNNFLWLCGHTHDRVEKDYGENFKVCCMGAEYTLPKFGAFLNQDMTVSFLK